MSGERDEGEKRTSVRSAFWRLVGASACLWSAVLLVGAVVWAPLMVTVLAVFASVFHLARFLVSLLPRLRKQRLACAARAVTYAVVAGVSFYTFTIYERVTMGRAEALVGAIDAYRAAEGRYPASLEALVPRFVERVPMASVAPAARWKFGYRPADAGYELYYAAGFMVARVYTSQTGEWQVRD